MSAEPDPVPPPGLKSHILRSLVKLPPMPQVILRAREVMEDPDSGLRDLARLIAADPALTAKVLALANSAYYGISGQVSSVQHAAVLLGQRALGDLIILSATAVLLEGDLAGYGLRPHVVWRHSLAAALIARSLARRRFPGLETDAFIVGLLHDIGKLILNPFAPTRFAGGAAEPVPDGSAGLEIERRWFGLDHAEAVALACRFWRFPDAQVRGLRYHHDPTGSSRSALAHIAHLADALAHRAGFGGGRGPEPELVESTLEFLQLAPADLPPLQADMARALAELEAGLPAA